FPNSVNRVRVKKGAVGYVTLAAVQDRESLAYLFNLGCVTPYTLLSRASRVDNPDTLIFDLDPTRDDFRDVREMALALRDLLALLGLKSFPMTTGSRGLHVRVPLDGNDSFEAVRQFALDVAHGLTDAYPETLTIERQESARSGRVFIDTA